LIPHLPLTPRQLYRDSTIKKYGSLNHTFFCTQTAFYRFPEQTLLKTNCNIILLVRC
jgi:hypothetical protein